MTVKRVCRHVDTKHSKRWPTQWPCHLQAIHLLPNIASAPDDVQRQLGWLVDDAVGSYRLPGRPDLSRTTWRQMEQHLSNNDMGSAHMRISLLDLQQRWNRRVVVCIDSRTHVTGGIAAMSLVGYTGGLACDFNKRTLHAVVIAADCHNSILQSPSVPERS